MNLDKYGLPVQANGDAQDQLQRCGMIAAASYLIATHTVLGHTCDLAMLGITQKTLQPRPGIYTRFIDGPIDTVSADQLISALAAHVAGRDWKQVYYMFIRLLQRGGFAQNVQDITPSGPSNPWKVPDFMLLRALPLLTRSFILFYPLVLVADLYLIIMSISAVIYSRQSLDNVDQNNTILTLAVAQDIMPTPISFIARKVFKWFLGPNNAGLPNRVYGSLLWYHRAASGGNPEIAEMWKPIVDKF